MTSLRETDEVGDTSIPAPRDLKRGEAKLKGRRSSENEVGRKGSPGQTFIPLSNYQAKGYLGLRGTICDTQETLPHTGNWTVCKPSRRRRQLVRQLQKQIQGSGFILRAGLTSGPPLKSSSRCLGETNEK